MQFSKPSYIVKESAEQAHLTINRVNGADGEVVVSWRTKDLSAKAGQEYVGDSGKITFSHGETSKDIHVGIIGIQVRLGIESGEKKRNLQRLNEFQV